MKKYGVVFLTFVLTIAIFPVSIVHSASEAERRQEVEEWDRMGLRYSTGFVKDTTKEFLKLPDNYPGTRDFIIARKAPTVEFAPIRGLLPEFFPDDNRGYWSQWAEVTKGPNGCFYMATGDHRCKDSKVYITEYDPIKKEQRIVVDVGKICDWEIGQYRDGKIHGRMDIMPDGTLVGATWLGAALKQEWKEHGWEGGFLVTYNVFTGMAENHGIPFQGESSWPYHSMDTQTGVIMAVGMYNYFMAYDVINRKLLYGGIPPNGIKWNQRSMLLDESTGLVYASDNAKENTFVCYDQRTNQFAHLKCKTPPSPVTGKSSSMRAYTARRTPEGVFWCIDQVGAIFKFLPDEEKTEAVTVNWDSAGVYTASVALSPKNRYLYYVPGAHGRSYVWGSPVVQYNLETNEKKVIAFLNPFIHKKYGYLNGGTFGIELSEDGSFLVIHMNGAFSPDKKGQGSFGNPAILVVHIPESERRE